MLFLLLLTICGKIIPIDLQKEFVYLIARGLFMYTYWESTLDKAESVYEDTDSEIENVEFLCADIDSELSRVLDLINCDVNVQIFLRYSKGITPYIASNNKEMSQEERKNVLSCVDNSKIVLSSKEVYFDELGAKVKLFLFLTNRSIIFIQISQHTYYPLILSIILF